MISVKLLNCKIVFTIWFLNGEMFVLNNDTSKMMIRITERQTERRKRSIIVAMALVNNKYLL